MIYGSMKAKRIKVDARVKDVHEAALTEEGKEKKEEEVSRAKSIEGVWTAALVGQDTIRAIRGRSEATGVCRCAWNSINKLSPRTVFALRCVTSDKANRRQLSL